MNKENHGRGMEEEKKELMKGVGERKEKRSYDAGNII